MIDESFWTFNLSYENKTEPFCQNYDIKKSFRVFVIQTGDELLSKELVN